MYAGKYMLKQASRWPTHVYPIECKCMYACRVFVGAKSVKGRWFGRTFTLAYSSHWLSAFCARREIRLYVHSITILVRFPFIDCWVCWTSNQSEHTRVLVVPSTHIHKHHLYTIYASASLPSSKCETIDCPVLRILRAYPFVRHVSRGWVTETRFAVAIRHYIVPRRPLQSTIDSPPPTT